MNLASIINTPRSGRPQAVILDHLDYSQAVILQNRQIPWDDPMAYANFIGQGQSLLKPDIAILHLDRFYAREVESNDRLRFDMSAKKRTGYALRTLLADGEVLDRAWALANTLTQSQGDPVVLQVPSPWRWLLATHAMSGKADHQDLDSDDAENASMFVADWLRNFSELPLAGVLLDDRVSAGGEHPASVDLDVYSPIINVTENYGWTLGMRREDTVDLWKVEPRGRVLDAEYWTGKSTPPPTAELIFSELPPTAVPEDVMARVAAFG